MARTELAVQTAVRTGLNPSYSAATADGFAIVNTGQNVFIHVKNANASACDVTITTQTVIDACALADKVVTVPLSTGERIIGPFPKAVYNCTDPTTGLANAIQVGFSVWTSVTVAAIKVPDPTY